MVGSSFILVNKNGRRLLFNTAQISAVKNIDVLLTKITRRHYWQMPEESDIVYLLRVEQPDGFTDLLFTDAAEREELFDKFIAAISPSAVLDSAPGLPHTWAELARMKPAPTFSFEGKEYDTKEAYMQAVEESAHQAGLAAVEALRQKQAATSPPTPSQKPPRKPYTRKPRE